MYQTVDGLTKIDVQMSTETVWLTREQMAERFVCLQDHSHNIERIGRLIQNCGNLLIRKGLGSRDYILCTGCLLYTSKIGHNTIRKGSAHPGKCGITLNICGDRVKHIKDSGRFAI